MNEYDIREFLSYLNAAHDLIDLARHKMDEKQWDSEGDWGWDEETKIVQKAIMDLGSKVGRWGL